MRTKEILRFSEFIYPDFEFVQQGVAQIPWGHNVVLMDKIVNVKRKCQKTLI